jgi:uncharacterized protein YcbK (DUF882 family)
MRYEQSSQVEAHPKKSPVSRRDFLKRAGAAAAGVLLVPSAEAFTRSLNRERVLNFYNPNTDEELSLAYSIDSQYDARLMRRFSEFMRDHHTNKVHPIDPALLDLLYAVSVLTRSNGTFQVISGYRSPETNHMLRRRSHRVAENSLHMQGRAIDIRMSDAPVRTVRKVGMALQRGGVGYYPSANFVHLDTGDVRAW